MRQFYRDLVESLTEPRRFYTDRYPQLTLSQALSFALIVNWIAAGLKWLTRFLNHETLLDGFLKIRDQLQQLPWWKDLPTSIWAQNPQIGNSAFAAHASEIGAVVLFPFSFLLTAVVQATALTIGAFLFLSNRKDDLPRDRTDISQFIKIAALASTPNLVGAVLDFLPLRMGGFVGTLYSFIMLVFAVSIRYRASLLRSFAVIVTPWFALIMVGACILGAFGAVLFGLIASLFGASN